MQADAVAGVLALDIGGTKIAGAILQRDATGELQVLSASSVRVATDPENVLEQVLQVAAQLQETATSLQVRPLGIGVASAGVVDPHTGEIVSATGLLRNWAGVPIAARLEEATGLVAAVLNDVHAHALGEARYGAATDAENALVAAVGTGIGGAFVQHGVVFSGPHHVAGHIGHVTHALAVATPCSCGKAGHIEAVASGSGLALLYNRQAPSAPVRDGKEVHERAAGGERYAQQVLDAAALAFGEVLGSLANTADPDVVVVTGSVTQAGERWWSQLREGFHSAVLPVLEQVPVVAGERGDDAPLLGAAAQLLQRLEKKENDV